MERKFVRKNSETKQALRSKSRRPHVTSHSRSLQPTSCLRGASLHSPSSPESPYSVASEDEDHFTEEKRIIETRTSSDSFSSYVSNLDSHFRVPLHPPKLPPLFVVSTSSELAFREQSSDVECIPLSVPGRRYTEVPLELLNLCAEEIVILTQSVNSLTREQLKNYAIDDQLNWFKSSFVKQDQQLDKLLWNVVRLFPQIEHQEKLQLRLFHILQTLIGDTVIKRLTNLSEASSTGAQSPIPTHPSEVISVNVSNTPTTTLLDHSSRFSVSPMSKCTPNSRNWTYTSPQPFKHDLPQSTNLKQWISGTRRLRSKSALPRKPRTLPNLIESKHSCVSLPRSHLIGQRSSSNPEGLNRDLYYRLVFLPSDCQFLSIKAQSVCEVRCCNEDPIQTNGATEDGCVSQMASWSFDLTVGSKFPRQHNYDIRDQICTRILRSMLNDMSSHPTRTNLIENQDLRACVERFLDHVIAITLTHRMNELSQSVHTNLSQMVSTASINLSQVMDRALLQGFITSDQHVLSKCRKSLFPGEKKAQELALQTTDLVVETFGSSLVQEDKKLFAAERATDRLLQLAYTAACTALGELLKWANKDQVNLVTTHSEQISLCSSQMQPLDCIHPQHTTAEFTMRSGGDRKSSSPGKESTLTRHIILEVDKSTLSYRFDPDTPGVSMKQMDPEHLDWSCSSRHTSRSEFVTGSSSTSYTDPEVTPVMAQKDVDIKMQFSTTSDVTSHVVLKTVSLKITPGSWKSIPVPDNATDLLCRNCAQNIHALIFPVDKSTTEYRPSVSRRSKKLPTPFSLAGDQEPPSVMDELARTDPPTLSNCVSGVHLAPENLSTSSELQSHSSDPKSINRTLNKSPKLVARKNLVSFTLRPPWNSKKSNSERPQSQKVSKKDCRKTGTEGFPSNCYKTQIISPRKQRHTPMESVPIKRSVQSTLSAILRRSSSLRGSFSEANSSPGYRTASSRNDSTQSSRHCRTESSSSQTVQVDPLYTCLEEVKQCLHKAECHLDTVNKIASEQLHITAKRTRRIQPPPPRPSERSYPPGRSSCSLTYSSQLQRQSTLSTATTPKTRPEQKQQSAVDNPSHTGGRWTHSEVHSCFPAPCMVLPIRQSTLQTDAGISHCLIYTKRQSRMYTSANGKRGSSSTTRCSRVPDPFGDRSEGTKTRCRRGILRGPGDC